MPLVENNLYTVVLNRQYLRRTGYPDIDYTHPIPTAPALSPVTTFGANTATVSWTETNDVNILVHNVYVAPVSTGVFVKGVGLPASARSTSISGLTAGTQYDVYVTRSTNGGESIPSNTSRFTTSLVGTVPPAPTLSATVTGKSTTGFTISWTENGGGALTAHGLFINGTRQTAVISGGATSFPVTGRSAGTGYDIQVTSSNTFGESARSNTQTISTLPGGGGTFYIALGISPKTNTENHTGLWDSVRIYHASAINNTVDDYIGRNRPNTVCAFSDQGTFNYGVSPTQSANAVESALNTFYNAAGNRDNVEFQVAIGNEVDNGSTTAASLTTFANQYEAISQVINGTTGGTRDWPMASVWIDLTTGHVQLGESSKFLTATTNTGSGKRVVDFLKGGRNGIACSFYPAAPQVNNGGLPYSIVSCDGNYAAGTRRGRGMEHYRNYIDPVFDLADQFGVTNISGWELGSNANRNNWNNPTWTGLTNTWPYGTNYSGSGSAAPSRGYYYQRQIWYLGGYLQAHPQFSIPCWIYWNSGGCDTPGWDYMSNPNAQGDNETVQAGSGTNTRDLFFNALATYPG